MDTSLLATMIGTALTIIGTNIVLITWLRSDMKSFETKIDTKIDNLVSEMHKETKDFHGRLCSLESRYHQQDMKKKNP